MKRVHLCTGILRRGDEVLLVRCRYEDEREPLWVLPGGRPEGAETIVQTIAREFLEETGLRVRPERLAYASESIDRDRDLHVINCTFYTSEEQPWQPLRPLDPCVVEARFVSVAGAPALLRADVLRIPVAAALSHAARPNYFAFDAARVDVPFFSATADESKG
jgi:ADP-ribose pyrophosphatase YjhB (NUDIX family)